METFGPVHCGKDASHDDLDLRGKRCRDCGCRLEKKCLGCEMVVSYSNTAKHTKTCKGSIVTLDEQPEEEENVNVGPDIRVGYLAAQWDVSDGPMPAGQYCAALCKGFPEHFRKLVLEDPTCDGEAIVVDAYDAIWGTIFASAKGTKEKRRRKMKLVHTFHSLDEVFSLRTAVDLLVVGNWAHPTAFEDESNGKALAQEMYHKLCELEVDRGVRIFPPLDYAWYFAQKVHYYNRLSMMLATHLQRDVVEDVHAIPMLPVPTEHFWKKQLQEFAKEHKATELMLKRELSETGRHVRKMKAGALGALEGRTSGFRWMAQPVLKEFVDEPEFRMFVINGRCCWGVATRFVARENDVVMMEKIACAPGRRVWDVDGGNEAAAAAERVVEIVSKDMLCAAKFLRVDMVKRNGGGWWINELEYFGNAFIHLEVFDNAPEMLDQLVDCVSQWVLP
jgi:hypothetical protein